MLSPAGFTSPFEHLSQDETKLAVQAYMAFLNDNTGLIATPGIKVKQISTLGFIRKKFEVHLQSV